MIKCMTSIYIDERSLFELWSVLLCDVVNEKSASGTTVIRTSDRTKTFLTSLLRRISTRVC